MKLSKLIIKTPKKYGPADIEILFGEEIPLLPGRQIVNHENWIKTIEPGMPDDEIGFKGKGDVISVNSPLARAKHLRHSVLFSFVLDLDITVNVVAANRVVGVKVNDYRIKIVINYLGEEVLFYNGIDEDDRFVISQVGITEETMFNNIIY